MLTKIKRTTNRIYATLQNQERATAARMDAFDIHKILL